MPRGVYEREPRNALAADMATEVAAPTPERAAARAAETRRERRRRDDGDLTRMDRMNLAIPPEVQAKADREGKTLRWMKDEPGRLMQAHANDWDKVEGVEPIAAGKSEETRLILHEKYQDWFDKDQRGKAAHLDKMERAIEGGAKLLADDKLPEENRYAVAGNRISRGA